MRKQLFYHDSPVKLIKVLKMGWKVKIDALNYKESKILDEIISEGRQLSRKRKI